MNCRCLLAACYLWCLSDLHPWTSGALGKRTYGIVSCLVVFAWGAYLCLHNHDIFAICFLCQVLVPAFISISTGPWPIISGHRAKWYAFLIAILVGKGCWEYERYIFRRGLCPGLNSDPVFWFHPIWHIGSALAHAYWMSYARSLVQHVQRDGRKSD